MVYFRRFRNFRWGTVSDIATVAGVVLFMLWMGGYLALGDLNKLNVVKRDGDPEKSVQDPESTGPLDNIINQPLKPDESKAEGGKKFTNNSVISIVNKDPAVKIDPGVEDPFTKDMQKLVHLDLKGAPPKVEYFARIFPLFSAWGATGILIEYEDMYPYNGRLDILQAPHAYTEDNIKHILQLARESNLQVIPLVQTFGHLEFVLKYEKFSHLREVQENPMDLSPVKEGALELVKDMIDQILKLHPQISYLHIGELYYVLFMRFNFCQLNEIYWPGMDQ